MRVAIIGHQLKCLGKDKKLHKRLVVALHDVLVIKQPEIVDIYLNPGFGFWAVKICTALEIPFRAIVPFKQCYTVWPEKTQNEYRRYLKRAIDTVYTDRQPGHILRSHPPDIYVKEKLFNMARWMAEQLDIKNEDELLITNIECVGPPCEGSDLEDAFNDSPLADAWYKSRNYIALAAASHLDISASDESIFTYTSTVINIVDGMEGDYIKIQYKHSLDDMEAPF